jgi:DNA-directed RNA polymerase subunit RPC12/RpoP
MENYPCPKCSNRNLHVLLLEEGRKGWEARVECDRCGSKMVVNEGGFHMDFTCRLGDEKK